MSINVLVLTGFLEGNPVDPKPIPIAQGMLLEGKTLPNIKANKAYYLLLVEENVTRLHHIKNSSNEEDRLKLVFGNSYAVNSKIGLNLQKLRKPFDYVDLSHFGFMQLQPGFLALLPENIREGGENGKEI